MSSDLGYNILQRFAEIRVVVFDLLVARSVIAGVISRTLVIQCWAAIDMHFASWQTTLALSCHSHVCIYSKTHMHMHKKITKLHSSVAKDEEFQT
jgi:hypothetical protein